MFSAQTCYVCCSGISRSGYTQTYLILEKTPEEEASLGIGQMEASISQRSYRPRVAGGASALALGGLLVVLLVVVAAVAALTVVMRPAKAPSPPVMV